MVITMIAAVSKNYAIGKQGKLPWHMPADLKYFKEMSLNKTVIMGRKSFDSLGRKPLPKRFNIIITSNPEPNQPNLAFAKTIDEAVTIAEKHNKEINQEEIMILGGGGIYEAYLPYADIIYLTEIETVVSDADAFFPQFSKSEWYTADKKDFPPDEKNTFAYSFVTYKRKPEFPSKRFY